MKHDPAGYKSRLWRCWRWADYRAHLVYGSVRPVGQMTDVSHFWFIVTCPYAVSTLAGLIWTALDLRRWYDELSAATG
jgi:hypothetical protein